jgi:hypothetical protein
MKPIALEIPDDTKALPGWLDRHLVGPDLGALVAELEAVHGPVAREVALLNVLGNHRNDVLAQGLATLPKDRLRRLLRQPRLLLDLQELILISGGPYWFDRAAQGPQRAAVDRGWQRLAASLATERTGQATVPSRSVIPMLTPIPVPSLPARSRWYRRGWVLSLTTIAAALLVVAAAVRWHAVEPRQAGVAVVAWGWSRPGALSQELPRADYLNRLADEAHEWFDRRPEDRAGLARRLAEFRQGCTTLIQARHRPLSAEDRAWLVEKCRAWAAKFDGYLAAVGAGQDPLQVRGQADETINRLLATLRDRAKTPA